MFGGLILVIGVAPLPCSVKGSIVVGAVAVSSHTYIILVPRDGTIGMRANIILFKNPKYSSHFKIAVKYVFMSAATKNIDRGAFCSSFK